MSQQASELQRNIKQLDQSKDEIELAKDQALEQLANLQKDTDSNVQALEEELAEAKEKAVRESCGVELLKKSCKDTIDKANTDHDRQVEALQAQLSQSRAKLEKQHDSIWGEMNQAWEREHHIWEEKLAKSAEKVDEIQADKLQAQRDHERALEELQTNINDQRTSMKEENEELRARPKTAEEKTQIHQRPSSRESRTSTRLQVPYTKDGIPSKITPTESVRSKQQPKPRKVIDRSKNEAREVRPIRVSEEIRPDSRRASSSNAQTNMKGPLVEESQNISNPVLHDRTGITTVSRAHGSFSFGFGEDSLNDPDCTPQPESQVIPETQVKDSLPTFASFNSKAHSSQAPPSFAFSTSDSARVAHGVARVRGEGQLEAQVFKVFDQSQQQSELSQSQHSHPRASHHGSQAWSREEHEKYSFSMPKPPPNSGSKRVPSIKSTPHPMKHHGSEQRSGSGKYQTPARDTAAENRMSSSHQSSPAFVQQTQSQSKRRKTYSTPKQIGVNRRTSQPDAGPISDPRLAGRDQRGTKRKPDIMEGYADERKKRLAVSSHSLEKNTHRAQAQQPQSINDLRGIADVPTSSTIRMQTFAGTDPRVRRSTRKLSHSK